MLIIRRLISQCCLSTLHFVEFLEMIDYEFMKLDVNKLD